MVFRQPLTGWIIHLCCLTHKLQPCCWSKASWPTWKHIVHTMLWHTVLPMLTRAANKPAGWSVKSWAIKFLIKSVIPFRALSQCENLTCLKQMQGCCTSVMLPCLPPGGSCRLFKQQTFWRGHLTLGKQTSVETKDHHQICSFAFLKATHYKLGLPKENKRHGDKTFLIPLSSLSQEQSPPPCTQLSHWAKDGRKNTLWLWPQHLIHQWKKFRWTIALRNT